MRKVLSLLLLTCLLGITVVNQVKAEPINLGITKWNLPEAQAGAIISFKHEGIEATLTTPLLSKSFGWGKLSLNGGGAPAINEPIVSLTYQLPPNAMEKWNIQIPYAKLFDVHIGLYGGFEINEYQNDPDKDWQEALDGGMAIIGASLKF